MQPTVYCKLVESSTAHDNFNRQLRDGFVCANAVAFVSLSAAAPGLLAKRGGAFGIVLRLRLDKIAFQETTKTAFDLLLTHTW